MRSRLRLPSTNGELEERPLRTEESTMIPPARPISAPRDGRRRRSPRQRHDRGAARSPSSRRWRSSAAASTPLPCPTHRGADVEMGRPGTRAGHEVITVSQHVNATVSHPLHRRISVFIDIEPDTYLMDAAASSRHPRTDPGDLPVSRSAWSRTWTDPGDRRPPRTRRRRGRLPGHGAMYRAGRPACFGYARPACTAPRK